MRQILLIMSITIREAIRRKVWLWILVMIAGLIVIDWATMYHPPQTSESQQVPAIQGVDFRLIIAMYFGANIILFFSSIIAVVLAAGQVSGDMDRGVLSTIVSKPVTRFQVILGKWLGVVVFSSATILITLCADWAFLVGVYGGEHGLTINLESVGVMLLYPVLYGTITLAWSSFGSMVLSLLMTATLYAITWIGDGIVQIIAEVTRNEALKQLWLLSKWIIPHQRLGEWRISLQEGFFALMREARGVDVTLFDKLYVIGYIVVFFLFAYAVFSRRDVH
jgi:Cu-processing system permease protein